MRVLHVTNSEVNNYGVAQVLQGLAAALPSHQIEPFFYVDHESAKTGRLGNGHPCQHGPLPEPAFLSSARSLRPLVDCCRQHRIDLIHCHGLYRCGHSVQRVRRTHGIPYLITNHQDLGPGTTRRMRRFRVRWRCRAILRDAAAVTHLSSTIAAQTEALHPVHDKSTLIANGIDLPWWLEGEAVPVAPYVLALGRLVPEKGFHLLIEALSILRQRKITASLVIAGAGEERSNLEALARARGFSVCHSMAEMMTGGICFPGVVGGENKRQLFKASQLVAFPSQAHSPEAFPVVFLEALAAGKAIVTSDIPCARDFLQPGKNAVYVPPGDVVSWVRALEDVLTNEGKRRGLESQNATLRHRFDWRLIAGQYAQVYQQVLDAEKCPRRSLLQQLAGMASAGMRRLIHGQSRAS